MYVYGVGITRSRVTMRIFSIWVIIVFSSCDHKPPEFCQKCNPYFYCSGNLPDTSEAQAEPRTPRGRGQLRRARERNRMKPQDWQFPIVVVRTSQVDPAAPPRAHRPHLARRACFASRGNMHEYVDTCWLIMVHHR